MIDEVTKQKIIDTAQIVDVVSDFAKRVWITSACALFIPIAVPHSTYHQPKTSANAFRVVREGLLHLSL